MLLCLRAYSREWLYSQQFSFKHAESSCLEVISHIQKKFCLPSPLVITTQQKQPPSICCHLQLILQLRWQRLMILKLQVQVLLATSCSSLVTYSCNKKPQSTYNIVTFTSSVIPVFPSQSSESFCHYSILRSSERIAHAHWHVIRWYITVTG